MLVGLALTALLGLAPEHNPKIDQKMDPTDNQSVLTMRFSESLSIAEIP
jgi:hypothetical protein